MATGIGETLRAARRQQGVGLGDAAAETRVRESYLAALEEEEFSVLGGDVYVKGFLRSYARFLGLDPEPLLDAYRAEYEHPDDDITPLAQQPVAAMPTERRPGLVVGLGAVALVVVLLALVGLFGGGDEPSREELAGAPPPVTESEPAPSVTPAARPSREPTERATDSRRPSERDRKRSRERATPSSDPTEQLGAQEVRMSLDVDGGESWMRVTVDGVDVLEGVQPDGKTLDFNASESITVRIGNAAAVGVTVNGREFGPLGGSGEVVTKTYLAKDAA